ncbi:MAG: TRAP transporter substrate-binding protein [Candidatus Rokuibacteriota bacterium]|nr:MAG: TRAP transporter substrate-binding protein [Candidatus Rokubacteria bacterium]
MLRWLLVSAVVLSLAVGLVPAAHAVDMGVITGGEKGTYYQFGLNFQALGRANGINMNVHTSKGSVENIYAVYQRPGIQLGIVQSDVLAFVARVQTDEALKRIAKKIKMVFPLYNEEIHLLAKKGINSFDDLANKRVAIGREGSGTYLTVRLLFKVSEVAPREMVLIDTDEALAELKAGRIDAMFYVAGLPVKLLAEGVTAADELVLVPITNKDIAEFYPRVTIPGGTYAWQPQAVESVTVKAVLVTFDYRRLDCDNVGKFAQVVSTNIETLVKGGHPKWKQVNLEFPLKGWEQYDCVKKYLNKPTARATTPQKGGELNPVMDAIREILRD